MLPSANRGWGGGSSIRDGWPAAPGGPCRTDTERVMLPRPGTETNLLTEDDLTVPGAESRFRVDAVPATGTIPIERPRSPAC